MGIYVYYTHSRLHKLYTQILQGDLTTMLTPIFYTFYFIYLFEFRVLGFLNKTLKYHNLNTFETYYII